MELITAIFIKPGLVWWKKKWTFSHWFVQAQSSGPAFPVTADVIEHLLQVGEGLMKNELQIYEQGNRYAYYVP